MPRTCYFRSARRAPIILGGLDEHSFKGARALTIQSTQLENTCEYEKESQKNKLMKYSLEKWGAPRTYYFRRARRALIILGARRAPIILGGLDEHPFLRGLDEHSFSRGLDEHSLFQGGTPALNNVALFRFSFVHK